MMLRRAFIIGSLVLVFALLAFSSFNVSAQTDDTQSRTIPANREYEVHLSYLEVDATITVNLFDASQPIRFFIYGEVYEYGDEIPEIVLDVYNVESGEWSFTVNRARNYNVVFVNDNPEPVEVEYSIEVDEVDPFDETMLWPVMVVIFCVLCIAIAVPLLMIVAIVVVIIIVIKMATKDDKKPPPKHHPAPQGYPYYPGYYQGEETPKKKKGKNGKKKDKKKE